MSLRALIVPSLLTVAACGYENPTGQQRAPEVGTPHEETHGKTPIHPTQLSRDDVSQTNGAGATNSNELNGSCGSAAAPISLIQGSENSSPLAGMQIVTSGIVVGDFRGPMPAFGGFFIQSELPDSDPATSEGLFVFDRSSASGSNVALGDRVEVAGTVREFFGLTEIQAVGVRRCGSGELPPVTPLPLPYQSSRDLEALEGMLVGAKNLTVTGNYDLGRFGELVLSSGGRQFHPSHDQGTTADENARRRILLDDGFDDWNVEPVVHLSPQDDTLRVGDTLDVDQAVLSFSFGAYRLQPVGEAVTFRSRNARPAAPALLASDLRVGSFNLRNYFVSLDGRGAGEPPAQKYQRDKLVSAIVALDADILGLTEIENIADATGAPMALDDLVAAVNGTHQAQVYARTEEPAEVGDDAIRSALIYKPARVQPFGLPRSHDDPIHVRPPIAQTFTHEGETLTVVVSHFKSKGGCPANPEDGNADHGQGCWNRRRVKQARALLAFVDELRQTSGDEDVIVVGDLNSYSEEDPVTALEEGGLVNQMARIPARERYSYVFQGESGLLDYAFATPSVRIVDAAIWHINADEPRLFDYDAASPLHWAPGEPFRSSDHDPVLVTVEPYGGLAD